MSLSYLSKQFHKKLCKKLLWQFPIMQNYSSEVVRKVTKGNSLEYTKPSRKLLDGPNLKDFFKRQHLKNQEGLPEDEVIPYLQNKRKSGAGRKVYFDVYGCQMNVNDTEIIWSILKANDFLKTENVNEADVVLIITCAIREGAETKIWNRLEHLKGIRNRKKQQGLPYMKIGILGCMAERLKHQVLEKDKSVDIVAGPDSYKDLPRLLCLTDDNETAINVMLSLDETYADVIPVRLNENAVTSYVSIMRGCDNMCTYCIVPFTRGHERSRPLSSILQEITLLSEQGVKEITLLGQNVNSYRDLSEENYYHTSTNPTSLAKGFKTVYKNKVGGFRFADLLHKVADINPEIRIRFTSPHPKDFPDEVLQVIQSKPNICNSLHLPAQSGNSKVLERMRRGYTREAYLDLVQHIREVLPSVHFSSDFICGFCGETDEEFSDTLSLIQTVGYNTAYLFAYSMREKTTAHRRYKDDVSQLVKHQRLEQMIKLYRSIAERINSLQIGQLQLVLVEGKSKRSNLYLQGRNDGNIKVIIPACEVSEENGDGYEMIQPGDYIVVQINNANSQILKGIPLYRTSLTNYFSKQNNIYDFYSNDYLKYNSMI